MLGCGKYLSVGGEFVVGPTTSYRTVVSLSVGGVVQHVRIVCVRVVEFGSTLKGETFIVRSSCWPHYAFCPSVCLSVRCRFVNRKLKKT